MKSSYFLFFILVLSFFIPESLYNSLVGDSFLYIDTSYGFTKNPERIINFLNNSYFLNVLDPISLLFKQYFSSASTLVFLCVILTITLINNKLNSLLYSIVFILTILLTFGIDSFILPVLTYLSLSLFLFEKGTKLSILIGAGIFMFLCIKVPAFSILFYIILVASVSSTNLLKSKFPLCIFSLGINYYEEPLRLGSYPDFSRVLKESAPFVDSWLGVRIPFEIAS